MTLDALKTRLDALPLFWKVYAFIVIMLIVVVDLAEFILEPLAGRLLAGMGGFHPWHEAVVWTVSIAVPALAYGYILSKVLSIRLGKMAAASRALARGNLEIDLPVSDNDRDAFDLLARSFNEMAGAIKIQRQNERRLLADISHELRSPLTRMAVAVELLNRRHTDTESLALTLRLENDVSQMNEMVSLLLAQSKEKLTASSGNDVVDMCSLIAGLTDDFAFQGEMRHITLRTSVTGDIRVYGNAMLLERMLANLLANAMFYSPLHGEIHLEARRVDAKIFISVRDFGPGVSNEQLEDIFRAFYRVDSSRARTSGGAGLGLALAREAALQHGGTITACNDAPGLRVTAVLPAHDPEQA